MPSSRFWHRAGATWHSATEAARLLGVSPEILRAWEQEYGYPRSTTSGDGELGYADADVQALRQALATELSITNAIASAQRRSRLEREG